MIMTAKLYKQTLFLQIYLEKQSFLLTPTELFLQTTVRQRAQPGPSPPDGPTSFLTRSPSKPKREQSQKLGKNYDV